MSDLKLNDKNTEVLNLQKRLIELGYSTCLIDNKVKKLEVDGDFGVITEGCLCSFQAKVLDYITDSIKITIPQQFRENLEVNGILDFRTKFVLDNYEKLADFYKVNLQIIEPELMDIKDEIVKKVLELARQNIGVVENGGNNYGKEVEEYQEIGSNGLISGGSPWCQFFQNYLLIKAAEELEVDFKGTYSGYTPDVVNWGKKKGITIINPTINDIEPGDWGFVYSSVRNSAKHVYLIEAVKNDHVITIEGNTNPGGGADGFGVFRRSRALGNQVWAIVKWQNLYK